jgi:hypothetical protein
MFKVAYPWASVEEEKAESEHHREIAKPKTGEEVAGNLWVHPDIGMARHIINATRKLIASLTQHSR